MAPTDLQVIFITHDAYRAETIEKAITGQGWRLLSGINIEQPLIWLEQQKMDAILLDLGVPGAVGLVEAIAQTHANTPLIVLAGPAHLTELQKALHSGARTFITFPIERQQIIATLKQARQPDLPSETAPAVRQRGRTVAITGLKGGIGRSTIAANLAVALVQQKRGDVILVEAHGGLSDLSLLLNLHPPRTLASLAAVCDTIDQDVIQGYLHTHSSGVRVLAAPSSLGELSEVSAICWDSIFDIFRDIASYIVVDTATAIDENLSQVLSHADDILVVLNPEMSSLRAATNLLEVLEEEPAVRARTHLILNRDGIKGGLDRKALAEQLRREFAIVLPDDAPLATFSFNRGTPFVSSHPRALLSRRLEEFVGTLFVKHTAAKTPASPKRSLIPFLNPQPA